jgi:putative glutamine amidotransferase
LIAFGRWILARRIAAVARSPEGIIEATETTGPDRFLIGVKSHPEKLMPESELQKKLIQAFIYATMKVEQ